MAARQWWRVSILKKLHQNGGSWNFCRSHCLGHKHCWVPSTDHKHETSQNKVPASRQRPSLQVWSQDKTKSREISQEPQCEALWGAVLGICSPGQEERGIMGPSVAWEQCCAISENRYFQAGPLGLNFYFAAQNPWAGCKSRWMGHCWGPFRHHSCPPRGTPRSHWPALAVQSSAPVIPALKGCVWVPGDRASQCVGESEGQPLCSQPWVCALWYDICKGLAMHLVVETEWMWCFISLYFSVNLCISFCSSELWVKYRVTSSSELKRHCGKSMGAPVRCCDMKSTPASPKEAWSTDKTHPGSSRQYTIDKKWDQWRSSANTHLPLWLLMVLIKQNNGELWVWICSMIQIA